MTYIVHLIHSGGFYGAERMLRDHCLSTPGEHCVLCLNASVELLVRFRQAGIRCEPCSGLPGLLRALHQYPGVLNAHHFRAQVYGWIAARWLGLPLLFTQHGFTLRTRKQRLYAWLSLKLCRSRTVCRVVCVAHSIARQLRQANVAETKITVIPNGLPVAPATVACQNATPLIGFVGRLSREKGPDLFLDALLPLCQRRPDLHLVLLGDGPERAALQTRVNAANLAERIHLPGYQENISDWLARLHVLVISSRTEGTPMVLLEAMQRGRPVVAFAVGGIPDMVENGRHALLVAPGDIQALTQRVEQLLDNPALAARLAAASQQRQHDTYHLPTLAQQWAKVYEQTRAVSKNAAHSPQKETAP